MPTAIDLSAARAEAMRVRDEDARYAVMLREAALEAQADTRPTLSHAEVRRRMDCLKADLQARLDAALGDGKQVPACMPALTDGT
ncbi:hypothetical protein LY625_09140 [Lysobacter sp. GX 14042]|uniref:hypothetical protein n=1 Tax=Lysobacter sp. GX 14042 TaxID=2907155 RepID=UPI001F3D1CF3|nr:hypothetical protein [Lysobacter sp. GX 14042]MCE7032772.1 hypothetical protein [Lysobacter sp. GX 14042]